MFNIDVIIVLALVAGIGVCKACQDALWHGWGRSIFAKFSEPTGYWGDAGKVWLRRYVNQDPKQGYVPALKNSFVRNLLIPVWDGWHLLAITRVFLLCLVPAAAGLPVWVAAVAFGVHTIAFEGTYGQVR